MPRTINRTHEERFAEVLSIALAEQDDSPDYWAEALHTSRDRILAFANGTGQLTALETLAVDHLCGGVFFQSLVEREDAVHRAKRQVAARRKKGYADPLLGVPPAVRAMMLA